MEAGVSVSAKAADGHYRRQPRARRIGADHGAASRTDHPDDCSVRHVYRAGGGDHLFPGRAGCPVHRLWHRQAAGVNSDRC